MQNTQRQLEETGVIQHEQNPRFELLFESGGWKIVTRTEEKGRHEKRWGVFGGMYKGVHFYFNRSGVPDLSEEIEFVRVLGSDFKVLVLTSFEEFDQRVRFDGGSDVNLP
jgi:hypothetical protein